MSLLRRAHQFWYLELFVLFQSPALSLGKDIATKVYSFVD